MFLMLAASGIEFDAQLDELHELEAADDDLSDGAKWSDNPDYWERIKETLLKFSSSREVKSAIQEWTSNGHVFVKSGGTCELCGKVPITFHFPIKNKVTNRALIVGNECVRNYQHLAGRVDLVDLQKRIRRQKDLLRSGKATPEKLSAIEELYQTEKQLRMKLAAFIDEADLDVLDYRTQLQEVERIGQILKVDSTAYKVGREVITACRNYLKFQDEVRKRQKYDAKGIGDLIGAIMRQKKGDYEGQIGQLYQIGRLMSELLSAGKPNEVIKRMWDAVSDKRDGLVRQIAVRGDEAKAKTLTLYADELQLTKPYPHLHFMIAAAVTEHRNSITKKVEALGKLLYSESFFDDVKATKSLPVSSSHTFYAELNYGETSSTVRSGWNVVQFIDLIRRDFLRNVIAAVKDAFKLPAIKDTAGVKTALLRAADDSIVDADLDGPGCVGKFVQLLQSGDKRVLDLARTEVDDAKSVGGKKVVEVMSADLGIDVEKVFKIYAADNPTENGIVSTIMKKTWPSGKKLSPAQMSNIQKQLMKYARTKERPNSMWAFFKSELLAPHGGSK